MDLFEREAIIAQRLDIEKAVLDEPDPRYFKELPPEPTVESYPVWARITGIGEALKKMRTEKGNRRCGINS